MDLDRGTSNDAVTADSMLASHAALAPPSSRSGVIGPEISTPCLRRCTALAARARVDLLGGRRHTASEELEHLLASIDSWEPSALVDPDPTMTVLAAAALQDLAERLPAAQHSTLAVRIEAALRLLHAVMDGTRIDAMA